MRNALIASFLFLAILAAICAALLIHTNGNQLTTTTTANPAIDENELGSSSSFEESNTLISPSDTTSPTVITTNVPIPTTVPMSSPAYYSAITSLLLSLSHPHDLLLDLSSPQHAAETWIVNNDDVTQMTDDQIIQRYIVTVVYFAMGGAGWTEQARFLSSDSECQWNNDGDALGVFCDDDGVVNRIILDNNNLKGVIPSEMGHLTMLHHLSLSNNYISGTIAPQLGNLTQLTTLDLSINELIGTLPELLGQLINLQYLYIFENQIYGTIPAELGRLDAMITLDLHKNYLSGTIPLELGSFSYWVYSPLSTLYLFDNKLSGMIPDEIKNLNQLTDLKIHLNDVKGDINDLCGSGMTLSADCLGSVPDVSCECCVYCCGMMHDVEICEHKE